MESLFNLCAKKIADSITTLPSDDEANGEEAKFGRSDVIGTTTTNNNNINNKLSDENRYPLRGGCPRTA